MTAKKRTSLGRGLDALLDVDSASSAISGQPPQTLPIDNLSPGKYQPRQTIDAESLTALADSIRAQGVIQPIIVRPIDGSRHEILAGERRWRAARQAGLGEVPVVVCDVTDDRAMMIALIENLQREDLNAVEAAQGIARLIETFGLTHQEAADQLGKSRSAISNFLRLLDLPEPILRLVSKNRLDMGHARALLPLSVSDQLDLARRIVDRGLSVREVETLVRQRIDPKPKASEPTQPSQNADRQRLEARLSDWLGTKTAVTANRKGAGRLTITFSGFDQLDGLLDRLGLPKEDDRA